jgi:hypothetical protein
MIRSKSVGQGQPPCRERSRRSGPGKHHRRPRNPSARGCSDTCYKVRPEPVDSAVSSKPNNEVTVPGRPRPPMRLLSPEYRNTRNTRIPRNTPGYCPRNTEETARQAGLSQLWTVGGTGLWENRRPSPTLNAVLRAGKETGSVKRGKRPNGRPLPQMHHSVGLARARATNDEKGPPRLLLLGRQPDFGRITENIAAGGKDDYINETHCFFGQNNVEEPFL